VTTSASEPTPLRKAAFGTTLVVRAAPTMIRAVPSVLHVQVTAATMEHVVFIVLGSLIIFFLIVEPNGLARLWQIAKQKLRVWPFPY